MATRRGQLRGGDGKPVDPAAARAVHPHRLPLRQLPRRRRPERTAVLRRSRSCCARARPAWQRCDCRAGCPACVGPCWPPMKPPSAPPQGHAEVAGATRAGTAGQAHFRAGGTPCVRRTCVSALAEQLRATAPGRPAQPRRCAPRLLPCRRLPEAAPAQSMPDVRTLRRLLGIRAQVRCRRALPAAPRDRPTATCPARRSRPACACIERTTDCLAGRPDRSIPRCSTPRFAKLGPIDSANACCTSTPRPPAWPAAPAPAPS